MPSVVFVLTHGGRVLMEQRPDFDSHFPNEWLFPGGKIEPGESLADALVREMREELGVSSLRYQPIGRESDIFYARPAEESHRLFPFLITAWGGPSALPKRVLDTGNRLAWRSPQVAARSPVLCAALIACAVIAVLNRPSLDDAYLLELSGLIGGYASA